MKILNEIKWLLVAGGAPCLGFALGVLLSFGFYPTDVEMAGKVLIISALIGTMAGISIALYRLYEI